MMNRVAATGLAVLTIGCLPSLGAADSTARPVAVYVTAQVSGQRLTRAADLTFGEISSSTEQDQTIFVDPSKTFQTVLGIGGALTDASAETFYKLPRDKQQELLRAYFDPKTGIGYSLGRTHIHSCDFSSESYVYVQNDDKELKTFDIAHDLKYRIPFTKEAMAVAGKGFTLFASPWSPPAWMKSNQDMLHGGKLLPEYYSAWADYYVKFIKAYEKQGIPIWGLTVQNEPMAAQTWESCIYTAEQERDFVKGFLGPKLRQAGFRDKKLMVWDHNRTLMYQRGKTVLDDPDAAQYVWGVAFHWYVNDCFENVKRLQESFPKANIMMTEGCLYPFDPTRLGDWQWGETYGDSLLNDFNNGAVGWTDWNVLLDEKGGPNHVGNFCYAPVHGDTRTGNLTYLNSFYYIGHFSKFVRPGAKRIVSASSLDDLQTTAFANPDGTIAVIVLNRTERAHPFLLWNGGKAAKTDSPAHSILTLVF